MDFVSLFRFTLRVSSCKVRSFWFEPVAYQRVLLSRRRLCDHMRNQFATLWCEQLQIRLQNTHVSRLGHLDNWLAKQGKDPEKKFFKCLRPLAGCGHRESTFQNNTEVRFGGAWLPAPPDAPNMSAEELQEIAMRTSSAVVQTWVKECRKVMPGIKRGDRAPLRLQLPQEQPVGCEKLGIYTKKTRHGKNLSWYMMYQ